jgi:hypothetical protein
VAAIAVRFLLHSIHPRGWMGAGVAMLGIGVGAAEYILARKRREERTNGGDPYTPPQNLTR